MVFRSLAALGVVTFVAATSAEYYEGDGTSYTLGDVSDGNCNFMSAIPTASTNYAALNNDQWDDLANCGRCAEVSCVDDQCTDQSATAIVQILDRCPECSSGDLDLSPTVFKNITGSDPSRLTIRWRFVDCPNPGTIEVCLKTGSNGYYVAVQPTNTLVGVETVTINGESTTMVDSAYYYLITSTSEVDLTSVKVSITSIEGETVEGTYSLTAGDDFIHFYVYLNDSGIHCGFTNAGQQRCGRCFVHAGNHHCSDQHHCHPRIDDCRPSVHHGCADIYYFDASVNNCSASVDNCNASINHGHAYIYYCDSRNFDSYYKFAEVPREKPSRLTVWHMLGRQVTTSFESELLVVCSDHSLFT
ncbi:Carbohydrate-binding protein [Phytophthora cinnamomi]|uniref:Carbohydrate-binding protein n=1 Tax=Phytophthora cinnamomi TaxID=4785 RepID=UPI00355964D6|nr:Carbohydrate-binding protein [Phytophthora cinnamomi]